MGKHPKNTHLKRYDMKKIKVLSLVLALLMLTLACTSCSLGANKASSYQKLFDKKYVPSADVYNSATAIADISGYEYADVTDEFILFEKANVSAAPEEAPEEEPAPAEEAPESETPALSVSYKVLVF